MELNQVAVPGVSLLIFFLGYPSQILFLYLEPGPLTKNELILSNVLLVCIFITYYQSVYVDPGRISKKDVDGKENGKEIANGNGKGEKKSVGQRTKWCRKCDAAKPPRAHHCKECKRCVPKMDHHCPWTANCVSHTTFPHFIRFLFYATSGLSLLAYFLWIRISTIWANRDLPAYLGPSPFLVAHLFVATIANSITLFALFVLLVRNIWSLAVNTTTIEGWEIERHKTLLRRARHFGGFLESPDGKRVRIQKQEFPYDVGIWQNIKQGMGTGNPIAWFNPFGATPPVETGLSFPTNGFNDPSLSWPPPDPDRSYRRQPQAQSRAGMNTAEGFVYPDSENTLAGFRSRQTADEVRRRKPFVQRMETRLSGERYSNDDADSYENKLEAAGVSESDDDGEEEYPARSNSREGSQSGEEAWRNSEGERLKDFGLDEEVEFYDEQEDDDVPLAELLARRRAAAAARYQ